MGSDVTNKNPNQNQYFTPTKPLNKTQDPLTY